MRPISNFPDYYITISGIVYSKKSNKQLKSTGNNGRTHYLSVHLRKNGKSYKQYIHRLLLETFVGPCPGGFETRHLDDNPSNNSISNLCWGTRSENQNIDRKRNGTDRLRGGAKGILNNHSKLNDNKVLEIFHIYQSSNISQRNLAKLYHVTQKVVWLIVNKKGWKHLW